MSNFQSFYIKVGRLRLYTKVPKLQHVVTVSATGHVNAICGQSWRPTRAPPPSSR